MSKRSIIEIAIRIYALYLMIQVPMLLWGVVSVFSMDTSNFVTNPQLYRIWAIVNPFLCLLISLILLVKAPFISKAIVGKQEEDTRGYENSLQQSNLSFWITLLGLYFLVTYVSSMIAELISIPIMAGGHYMWSIIVAKGIVIGVAVFMTFRSKRVMKAKGTLMKMMKIITLHPLVIVVERICASASEIRRTWDPSPCDGRGN